ncbi:uncharacterized protein EV154DRAFT_569236 [Mucor mucedo]|uniref:uncharacterized protein n=1 Tax=Mucor mucedo TaxID=29922 RepID=UPI00221ECAD7|nr:uncharacterized protein EV154DRAFT_569236 [Mucor mucedo]KAI7876504.1 hypothetical protein EV154DRAFT_569236 [Mucor mucedo]
MGGVIIAAAAGGYFCWEKYKTGAQMLDVERYVPLKVVTKEQISPDSYRLRLSTKQIDKEFPVPSCLYIKDDTIQVMRAYTPINSNPYKDGFVDLVVKRYPNGSVSRTLSGFEPQDDVHVRGPMIEEYEYKENTLDQVGMIAGGTGIAPMFQLICRILENPNDKTSIWLVYGNKKLDDILLKSELDQLQKSYPDRLKIKYVLESPPNDQYEKGYITKEIVQDMLTDKTDNRKIFVCGPSKLLELVCGERARDYSQGQVTGILSHLGLSSNEVWKFQ